MIIRPGYVHSCNNNGSGAELVVGTKKYAVKEEEVPYEWPAMRRK